jgi:HlyD family secretion protein
VLLRQQAAREELARSEINLNQQLSDLASLRNRYALNDQISGRMQGLIRQGAMAQLELDRQNERQEELAATIRRTEQEVASARRRVQESRLRRDQIPAADRKQLYAQFDNARQQLLEADGRLQDLQERLSLGSLKAPIAGRIDDLTVKAGEVATTATPAMRIVPQSTLQAELAVFNKDVGFLRLGQPVEVRVDSFPFTDYGALKGTLVRIAADVRQPDMLHPQPYFPVIVSLPANQLSKNGRTFDLRAGMAVSALIKLGQRPVISLILDRFGSFLESTSTIR